MKYINTFKNHASYEEKLNGGGVDISLPNVSYCKDVKDVHYNPYNLIEFYVGEISGTTPQTVKIYTDSDNFIPIQVSEGNKWYSYVLPKNKELYTITENEELSYDGDIITKVIVKANISYSPTVLFDSFIPNSVVEASFKGSNTSNVTNISFMFYGCSGLTSLDLSGWNISNVYLMNGMFNNCSKLTSLNLSSFDTSNVTDMSDMFNGCAALKTITMKGCSEATVNKIKAQLTTDGIINNVTITT